MKPFEYFAPTTLAEACALLARHNGSARMVAGGTDLLLKMKAGRLAPKVIVNIKRLPDLRGLTQLPVTNYLSIGSLTTLEQLRLAPLVREHYPALASAASTMASVQIRNLATVGGNLCNAAPSADLAPILMALNATARIVGPGGERRVALDDFFTGPGATVLTPGELLVSVEVPPPTGFAVYLKHSPRVCMDIAVVGVGLSLQLNADQCQSARIVLGAVAPVPLRARRAEAELTGGPLTPERLDRVAHSALTECQPIDDVRGSAWYRRKMVGVLVRRGLTQLSWS